MFTYGFIRHSLRAQICAFFAAAAVVLSLVGVPAAQAGTMGYGQCPAMVIVAARGSEQNEQIFPTHYNAQSPYQSNGYEERTLRDMLFALENHRPGILRDTLVLGLKPEYYAAALPLPKIAEEGVELSPEETFFRIARIVHNIPVGGLVQRAMTSFKASLYEGLPGVVRAVDDFEAETGCHPRYILAGYSQGAMVLAQAEQELHARGQLAGVIHLGDPYQTPGEAHRFGPDTLRSGMLTYAPHIFPIPQPVEGVRRILYCLKDDPVCDSSVTSAMQAAQTSGGQHVAYFKTRQPIDAYDALVLDTLASWL